MRCAAAVGFLAVGLCAQGLSAGQVARVDALARQALAQLGAPSASVAVVESNRLAYAQAYGEGRIDPKAAATPEMRYSIGSISKQFTAAAVLKLQEEGKLKLDDAVSKYLSGYTRGNEVTIRELLSHTSGYEDYAPQDYMIPAWLQPTTPEAVVNHWARLPLNFEPGTQWQYSNTNYKLAGLIAQKVSGTPLFEFLQKSFFTPLGMRGIVDLNKTWLGPDDAQGAVRNALGPARTTPNTAPGWDFGDGELGMTASDVARWQVSMLAHALLRPASYSAMETATKLKSGQATAYGLGLDVGIQNGHRFYGHSGEEIGFTAQELVFPDDRFAVVVLANQSANGTAGTLARQIAQALLAPRMDADAAAAARVFAGLQQGHIDRALFTADANFYFNAQTLADYAASLGPLGPPLAVTPLGAEERGGMHFHSYLAQFPERHVEISIYQQPDGKIEQYLVFPHS